MRTALRQEMQPDPRAWTPPQRLRQRRAPRSSSRLASAKGARRRPRRPTRPQSPLAAKLLPPAFAPPLAGQRLLTCLTVSVATTAPPPPATASAHLPLRQEAILLSERAVSPQPPLPLRRRRLPLVAPVRSSSQRLSSWRSKRRRSAAPPRRGRSSRSRRPLCQRPNHPPLVGRTPPPPRLLGRLTPSVPAPKLRRTGPATAGGAPAIGMPQCVALTARSLPCPPRARPPPTAEGARRRPPACRQLRVR